MNTIDIKVRIRGNAELVDLVLFQKIYSTPYGIVNHWSTNNISEHRLEVIVDEEDISVNPTKITKSMSILADEWEIADQVMLKLYEKGIFQKQNHEVHFNNS